MTIESRAARVLKMQFWTFEQALETLTDSIVRSIESIPEISRQIGGEMECMVPISMQRKVRVK